VRAGRGRPPPTRGPLGGVAPLCPPVGAGGWPRFPPHDSSSLPKGMSAQSLDAVVMVLRPTARGLSATEVATVLGASRVTARRYLEYLADTSLVARRSRYGSAGRPEVEYRWIGR